MSKKVEKKVEEQAQEISGTIQSLVLSYNHGHAIGNLQSFAEKMLHYSPKAVKACVGITFEVTTKNNGAKTIVSQVPDLTIDECRQIMRDNLPAIIDTWGAERAVPEGHAPMAKTIQRLKALPPAEQAAAIEAKRAQLLAQQAAFEAQLKAELGM